MIDASLIAWESGTDLVIDTEVDAPAHEVWLHIAHPAACAEWFAPFVRDGEDRVRFTLAEEDRDGESGEGRGDESREDRDGESGEDRGDESREGRDSEDGDGKYPERLMSDGRDGVSSGDLEAEILSCTEDSHVLLEFAALGRVGITLRPTEQSTRISLTCTFDSAAEAAHLLVEVGPVWETHLRLLREALGAGPSDVPESELYSRYDQLAAQARMDAADEN